ncbi:MAG: hypothetical protein LBK42_07580 [Propionibacteriaceae bacterium]|jgi:hypothetical protein|nr:hypothetical protein [Propionibacteriaceae bacterium]
MPPDDRPRPRDDDELFADIVRREFSEQVGPPPRVAPPAPPAAPFEFNLYDDDESYRQTPAPALNRLSLPARVGLIALAVALVGGLLLTIGQGAPGWVGWIVVGLFGLAVTIGIRQLMRRPGSGDDDDSGVV